MTGEEAIKVLQDVRDRTRNSRIIEAICTLHPELAESEDERIRAVILKLVLGMRDEIFTTADKLVTKPKVLAWLKKQKEQKPIQTEDEKEYVRTLKSLIADFLRGKEEVDRSYYQKIYDWLDGRHIEQKPEDRFAEAREKYQVEWSEEDEDKIKDIIDYLECWNDFDHGSESFEEYRKRMEGNIQFMKSLRPSWKPSKNEERLINTSISFLKDFADKGYENAVECIDWLKSKLNGNSGK